MMTFPIGLKIGIGLLLVPLAFAYFLVFIGGGAGGRAEQAYLGLLLGGLGLAFVAYSLFLLTRPSLALWQVGTLFVPFLPLAILILRRS